MSNFNNFIFSNTLGSYAEAFVRKHYRALTGEQPFMCIPIDHSGTTHIEGLDLLTREFTCTTPSSFTLPDYIPLDATVGYDLKETDKEIEVKSLFNSSILIYSHKGRWQVPTVPFELWSSSTRSNEGWLLQMENPEAYNLKRCNEEQTVRNNERFLRVVQPDVFTYLCYTGSEDEIQQKDDTGSEDEIQQKDCTGPEDELQQKPFMAITFPKYREQVLPFLYEYGKEYGLDLKQFPPHDPSDEQYWKDLQDRFIVVDRLLNVPFDLLKSMARVVMIDEPPEPADYFQTVHLRHYQKASEMTITTH